MAKEEYKGIWVFAEQEHGTLHPTVFELLAKAAELKAVCGETITAVLLGSGVRALTQELFDHGADEVILAEDDALAEYSARPYQAAFTQLAQRGRPSIVLFGATPAGQGPGSPSHGIAGHGPHGRRHRRRLRRRRSVLPDHACLRWQDTRTHCHT